MEGLTDYGMVHFTRELSLHFQFARKILELNQIGFRR